MTEQFNNVLAEQVGLLEAVLEKYPVFEILSAERKKQFCTDVNNNCYKYAYNYCVTELGITPNYNNYLVRCYLVTSGNLIREFQRQLVAKNDYLLHSALYEIDGITANNIAELSPEQWDPKANFAIYERVRARTIQKIERKTIKNFICKNCGRNEGYEYHEFRSRADEAAKLVHECANCGKRY